MAMKTSQVLPKPAYPFEHYCENLPKTSHRRLYHLLYAGTQANCHHHRLIAAGQVHCPFLLTPDDHHHYHRLSAHCLLLVMVHVEFHYHRLSSTTLALGLPIWNSKASPTTERCRTSPMSHDQRLQTRAQSATKRSMPPRSQWRVLEFTHPFPQARKWSNTGFYDGCHIHATQAYAPVYPENDATPASSPIVPSCDTITILAFDIITPTVREYESMPVRDTLMPITPVSIY